MIALCIAIMAIIVTSPSQTADTLPTPNTYQGVAITAENLLNLSESFDGSTLHIDPQNTTDRNMIMQKIDETGKTAYWIKISGRVNRIFTGMHTRGADGRVWTDAAYRSEQVQQLLQNPVQTYQTASRAAFYLIANEALAHHDIESINIPRTHLYSTNNSSIDDNHAIIKEEHIPGEKLEQWLVKGNTVPTHQLRDLFTLTESIGLWCLNNNILVDESGRLVPVDLEQPNNSNAHDFFYKNPVPYHGNVVCGIKDGLYPIFVDDKEAIRALTEWVEESGIINHERFTSYYQKEIHDFFSQQANT